MLLLRLKLIGAVLFFGASVLAFLTALAFMVVFTITVYNTSPLERHIARVLDRRGLPIEHERDMRAAAEAALTYGCQTAGLYPGHGFDYYDHLHIRFLNRPEWAGRPDKRGMWVDVNEVGRPYVAQLSPEQRTALCQEIRMRASDAGY